MTAFAITYNIKGKAYNHSTIISAKDSQSAKKKIGKRHGYKDGRMIQFVSCNTVGYF